MRYAVWQIYIPESYTVKNIVCQVSDVVHGPLNVSGDAEGMAIFVIFK